MRNFILKRIYLFANRFDGRHAQNVRVWCIVNMKTGREA
jgi:hypothetical protein